MSENRASSTRSSSTVGLRALPTRRGARELNFFETPGVALLVDMPGYGFAEAPKAKVEAWTKLVRDYLRGRATLLRVLLLIDARHGLVSVDRTMMALPDEAAVSSRPCSLGRQDQAAAARRSDCRAAGRAGARGSLRAVLATSAHGQQWRR
jgi:hypothetical protein